VDKSPTPEQTCPHTQPVDRRLAVLALQNIGIAIKKLNGTGPAANNGALKFAQDQLRGALSPAVPEEKNCGMSIHQESARVGIPCPYCTTPMLHTPSAPPEPETLPYSRNTEDEPKGSHPRYVHNELIDAIRVTSWQTPAPLPAQRKEINGMALMALIPVDDEITHMEIDYDEAAKRINEFFNG
jgi:hypothetical protein